MDVAGSKHPLDRPVWNSLNGRWAPLALRAGSALRLDPNYGPFAATPDLTAGSLSELAAFDPGEGGLDLVESEPATAPPGLAIALEARLVQMTSRAITPGGRELEAVLLDEGDAPEMLALAQLTRPGPFAPRTQGLGGFIGVKSEGRLVAMAGERMKPDGFCEVSGVCTHPEHRGRGYAGSLMRLVARRILERGETAFLHAYETNTGAIGLYRTLGFEIRSTMALTVLKRSRDPAAPAD